MMQMMIDGNWSRRHISRKAASGRGSQLLGDRSVGKEIVERNRPARDSGFSPSLLELHQIPQVAVEILEHRDDAVAFLGWLADEDDAFAPV